MELMLSCKEPNDTKCTPCIELGAGTSIARAFQASKHISDVELRSASNLVKHHGGISRNALTQSQMATPTDCLYLDYLGR